MATKTAEKKSTIKKGAQSPNEQSPAEVLANDLLVSELYRALVRLGEPARPSEIVREIGDEVITPSLARTIMEAHPVRFVQVDRRWDVTSRYFDKQRPVERILEEVVALYAAPMPVDEIASELGTIYGRVREHFDQVAPRLLNGKRFFSLDSNRVFGLRSWLLDTSASADKDILFYNYLKPEDLTPYEKTASSLDWTVDPLGAALALLAVKKNEPIDNRVIQWFAWKQLGEDFDAHALYELLYNQGSELKVVPDHRWLTGDTLAFVRAQWQARAELVADMLPEELAGPAVDLVVQPLEVTNSDAVELQKYFADREEIITVTELLQHVFEVSPHALNFANDTETLTEYLRSKPEDFLWVGTDRFRAPDTLPPYIGQLPESLTFPLLPRFETADGEILDQMLSDRGFEEALMEQILDPVAQDVNDQESADITRWPENVSPASPWLRLVLKAHHKEIGTFPLAQIPPGFFPTEPNIVELTLLDSAGNAYPIYVDYDVQLVYGLFDVYANISAESGAVFHIEKTDKPNVYKFTYGNETDSAVFINQHRYEELTDYRAQIEAGDLISTYDLVRYILDHYRKGSSFLTLLTEVNVLRRTPRRLIASILSSYAAFHERANRWTFDIKKEPEGFDKRKTEFIVPK